MLDRSSWRLQLFYVYEREFTGPIIDPSISATVIDRYVVSSPISCIAISLSSYVWFTSRCRFWFLWIIGLFRGGGGMIDRRQLPAGRLLLFLLHCWPFKLGAMHAVGLSSSRRRSVHTGHTGHACMQHLISYTAVMIHTSVTYSL